MGQSLVAIKRLGKNEAPPRSDMCARIISPTKANQWLSVIQFIRLLWKQMCLVGVNSTLKTVRL